MANKYLTASGAFATSGDNCRVYRVTIGATDAASLILKTGGTGGTAVFGIYAPAGESVQAKVPGIVADYATASGTTPHITIEYSRRS